MDRPTCRLGGVSGACPFNDFLRLPFASGEPVLGPVTPTLVLRPSSGEGDGLDADLGVPRGKGAMAEGAAGLVEGGADGRCGQDRSRGLARGDELNVLGRGGLRGVRTCRSDDMDMVRRCCAVEKRSEDGPGQRTGDSRPKVRRCSFQHIPQTRPSGVGGFPRRLALRRRRASAHTRAPRTLPHIQQPP